MAPTLVNFLWSIAVPITSSPPIVSFAIACCYNLGVGPGYLWVARRRSVFRSSLGVLFAHYPVYLENVRWSATCGGARWRITDNPTRAICFNKNEMHDISVDYLTVLSHVGRSCVSISVQRQTVFKVFMVFICPSKVSRPSTSFQLIILDNAQSKLYDLHQGWRTSLPMMPVYMTSHTYQIILVLNLRFVSPCIIVQFK